jgi:hypothetical protein
MNILTGDEREAHAFGVGLTRGFFDKFNTKNISVVKNMCRALPHLRDIPGEWVMA